MSDASAGGTIDLSVVIPTYNEARNIEPLLAQLIPVLDGTGLGWEVIFVDDGSRDNSFDEIRSAHARDPRIKAVGLSKNFGKEPALTAGLQFARGAAVLPMDADLQHPPELIPLMLDAWRNGADVVVAVRTSREADPLLRKIASRWFYRVFNSLSDTSLIDGSGDFRLLDRRVVDVLNRLPERARFLKGLYSWVGFRQVMIPFDVAPRNTGTSSFGLLKLFRYSLDALTSFSTLPLRMWSLLGIVLIAVALLYALYAVISVLVYGNESPGFLSLLFVIILLGGLQFLTLGILGEYIGRIIVEVKGRPIFVVRETVGTPAEPSTRLSIPPFSGFQTRGPDC